MSSKPGFLLPPAEACRLAFAKRAAVTDCPSGTLGAASVNLLLN